MANAVHRDRLREGPGAWNAWRSRNSVAAPELDGVELTLVERQFGPLQGGPVDLSRASLRGVNLRHATLPDADLTAADLTGADLTNARLCGARLEGASLSGVTLDRTDVGGATFTGAILDGASLQAAYNLTQEQIDGAEGNAETGLPSYIERPERWSSPRMAAIVGADEWAAWRDARPLAVAATAPAPGQDAKPHHDRSPEPAEAPEASPHPEPQPVEETPAAGQPPPRAERIDPEPRAPAPPGARRALAASFAVCACAGAVWSGYTLMSLFKPDLPERAATLAAVTPSATAWRADRAPVTADVGARNDAAHLEPLRVVEAVADSPFIEAAPAPGAVIAAEANVVAAAQIPPQPLDETGALGRAVPGIDVIATVAVTDETDPDGPTPRARKAIAPVTVAPPPRRIRPATTKQAKRQAAKKPAVAGPAAADKDAYKVPNPDPSIIDKARDQFAEGASTTGAVEAQPAAPKAKGRRPRLKKARTKQLQYADDFDF